MNDLSHMPQRKVTRLNDLTVLHFRTENHMTDAIRQWKYDNVVMVAESCARQVWVGLSEDFAGFPYPDNNVNAVKALQGADAYRFLLHLISGNDSAKLGESNVAGQFYHGLEAYEKTYPELAARMNTLMQFVRADANMIRREVTGHIRPPRHEMAARSLSGQKGGEKVLVIGKVGDKNPDTPSLITTALFKALGNNRKSRVGQITLAHPVMRTAITLEESLHELKSNGFVQEDVIIERIPFNILAAEIENHQRIFIDMAMGERSDIDQQLIDIWQGRVNRSNTLVHMRGQPANMGNSSPLWARQTLDNYVSPEDIRSEMARLGQENKRLQQLAADVVGYCTQARFAGDTPNWHKYQKTKGGPAAAPSSAGNSPV